MRVKYVEVPFEGGYARLQFQFDNGNWICIVPEQTMSDLEAYMNGETPRELVRPYIDGNGLWD